MTVYLKSVGGEQIPLMVRMVVQRARLNWLPALSFVPEALDPPNGCCLTTAPLGLSLM